jgi:hypothetical protein
LVGTNITTIHKQHYNTGGYTDMKFIGASNEKFYCQSYIVQESIGSTFTEQTIYIDTSWDLPIKNTLYSAVFHMLKTGTQAAVRKINGLY